jgi:hypothetical protein
MKDRGGTRWCELCGKHVHDLSRRSRGEIATLMRDFSGRVCGRSYADATGRLLTADDRNELVAIRRRIRVASVLQRVAAVLGIGTIATTLIGCASRGREEVFMGDLTDSPPRLISDTPDQPPAPPDDPR